MRPPGPHHIFRTDCPLHLAPHLPCKVCNQGKKGKPQNLAHSAVASGVQGCGRVGSRRWNVEIQRPLLKMGGESLRIGILQLKQLKAFCSFFSPCPPLLACLATVFTHLPSVLLTPCLSWLPTLPACRARHTAARVGCWLVARWTWPAAAAIHMGDEARTANIAVLHECSLIRTRAGSTRDQFHHDISTTQSPYCFKCFIVVWSSSSVAWTHINSGSISGGRWRNGYAIGRSWLLSNLTIPTHPNTPQRAPDCQTRSWSGPLDMERKLPKGGTSWLTGWPGVALWNPSRCA